jgi:hypothetical protein
VLNAGARKDDGLTGSYADMMSPAQLAGLDPAMHRDMDGDMEQQEASLEFSGRWRDLSTDLRWTRRDYGIYAFTPAFDDGTRIRLDTWHASLGWAHRFSDRLGLRVTGTHSQEHYDVYQADFCSPSSTVINIRPPAAGNSRRTCTGVRGARSTRCSVIACCVSTDCATGSAFNP